MKKFIAIALIGAFAVAHPAFAQSQNDEAIKADVQALDKDNAALEKDKDTLAKDRAAKAVDTANHESGKQAVDSVKIGAVDTAIAEKKIEKSVDEKILAHHKEAMKKDDAAPAPATGND
jgi:hypothetical protein